MKLRRLYEALDNQRRELERAVQARPDDDAAKQALLMHDKRTGEYPEYKTATAPRPAKEEILRRVLNNLISEGWLGSYSTSYEDLAKGPPPEGARDWTGIRDILPKYPGWTTEDFLAAAAETKRLTTQYPNIRRELYNIIKEHEKELGNDPWGSLRALKIYEDQYKKRFTDRHARRHPSD